jgi:hypothetical protein
MMWGGANTVLRGRLIVNFGFVIDCPTCLFFCQSHGVRTIGLVRNHPYSMSGDAIITKDQEELRWMVEAVGAKLPFLTPYCPIDNPIECSCWRRTGIGGTTHRCT